MREKILSYLGFAAKSGNLISGSNAFKAESKKKKIEMLLITEDTSENTKKEMIKIAEMKGIPYRIWGNSVGVSGAVGRNERNIFAIKEKNLAEAIIKEIDLM